MEMIAADTYLFQGKDYKEEKKKFHNSIKEHQEV
jgi:hypothetical protein